MSKFVVIATRLRRHVASKRRNDDKARIATTLVNLGDLAMQRGDYARTGVLNALHAWGNAGRLTGLCALHWVLDKVLR